MTACLQIGAGLLLADICVKIEVLLIRSSIEEAGAFIKLQELF
jgi:hypothetical protein